MKTEAQQALVDVHATVLGHVGITHGNFNTAFNKRLTVLDVSEPQVVELASYITELSRPRDGYLINMYDWYRDTYDTRLWTPMLTRAKAPLFWVLASFATASELRAEQLGPDAPEPWGREVAILSYVRPTDSQIEQSQMRVLKFTSYGVI